MKSALFSAALAAVIVLSGLAAAQNQDEEYEIGGPLAGLKLPLFPTQNGEPPGYPGCFVDDEGNFINPPQGNSPQLLLYPGAVENWRAYWFHYMPIRSFFDRQSQIHNWVADPAGDPGNGYPPLPNVRRNQIEQYAAPVYWVGSHGPAHKTDRFLAPVPVIRCGIGDPVFNLDLGELDRGIYVVRVVAAVQTDRLRPFMEPLYFRMRVIDETDGADSAEYRVRSGYNDEFYSIAEIYFHVTATGRFRAELTVDEGSRVEPLVHNISFDDALAGIEWRRVKERSVAEPSESPDSFRIVYVGERERLTPEERLERDAAIWKAFPEVNKPGHDDMRFNSLQIPRGAQGKTLEEIAEEHGSWEYRGLRHNATGREAHVGVFAKSVEGIDVLMTNEKLELEYTIDDLAAGRPLPDPFPYKDDGAGLYYPDPDDPAQGMAYLEVSRAVNSRIMEYLRYTQSGGHYFQRRAQEPNYEDFARDSAIVLIRYAYAFPTLDFNNFTNFFVRDPGFAGRNIHRRRKTYVAYGYVRYLEPVQAYDRLYDYINGNEDLAQSVGRFVPWVETSEDVLTLLDVYLVQQSAKRVLRYHYYGDGRQPEWLAELAKMTANAEFTDPWMQWLFNRVFFYPNPPTGIQDIAIIGTDRDGRSPIGSYGYMIGEFSADKIAERLEAYINAGGDPKYDLRDAKSFPKAISSLYSDIRFRTAGLHFPRFGSGSGYDKIITAGMQHLPPRAAVGWRWTRDPIFAYAVMHYGDRDDWNDLEWEEIEAAAATLERAPWFDNRSRIHPGIGAFLETGLEHDDFRFRRSAWVRTGIGQGHHHEDTLDLQIHAHGVPIAMDTGQRRDTAYSAPRDIHSRVHNVVVVDNRNWMGHSWARAMTDIEDARYMMAQAAPLHASLFRRQVALIDVDEGEGSQKLGPEQFGYDPRNMPADVVTPNSYVFDVFRVAGGGNTHTYSFHATVNDLDGPHPEDNLLDRRQLPEEGQPEDELGRRAAAWMDEFPVKRYFGTAPDDFHITFRMPKERRTDAPFGHVGTENFFMRNAFDPESPDKFLRLHIPGQAGQLVMRVDQHCHARDHHTPHVYIQRQGENLESAFAAIIEPYAGEPFIESVSMIDIPDNEEDALRAVAVLVEFEDGEFDICFADGRPDRTRKVEFPWGDDLFNISAEFAMFSDRGQLAISGGTLFEGDGDELRIAKPEHRAKVVAVDYHEKTVTLDSRWPQWNGNARLVEIGMMPEEGDGYTTSYMATASQAEGDRTTLTFLRGADYYRSRIMEVDDENGVVICASAPPGALITQVGRDKNLYATNDDMTRSWRAEIVPTDPMREGYSFRLTGAPVTAEDFAPNNALRLWEYGAGDTVRMNTFFNMRVIDEDDFLVELTGDVDVELLSTDEIPLLMSGDRENFIEVDERADDGRIKVVITAERFEQGPVYLKPQM